MPDQSVARSTRLPDITIPADLGFIGSIPGPLINFEAGQEIYGGGEPATYAYRVVSGVVRTFTLLGDGRRQIEAFHFTGGIFGIDVGTAHRASAEAVCGAQLLAIKRSRIDEVCKSDCAAAHELWSWTALALESARNQMLLLGRKNAAEKVASFILEMSKSCAQEGMLALPMGRTDIADYLGLTIETISRTLAQLESDGAIAMTASRHIALLDSRKLVALIG